MYMYRLCAKTSVLAAGADFADVQSGVSDIVVSVSWLVGDRSSDDVESDDVWMEDRDVHLDTETGDLVSEEDRRVEAASLDHQHLAGDGLLVLVHDGDNVVGTDPFLVGQRERLPLSARLVELLVLGLFHVLHQALAVSKFW